MSAEATLRIVGEDATGAAWAQVLSGAQQAAESMRSIFAATFAGISVAGIAGAVSQSLQLGEALKKAGEAAGVSGGTMSELAYVGKLAGVSMEDLSIGLRKMEQSVSLAASGSKEHALALEVLNLRVKELEGLAPDKMFELIGSRIASLSDPTDRARAAIELFGRAGTQLIPIFMQGGDAVERLRAEARQLGLALTDDVVDKLSEAEKSVKELDTAFSNLWTTLVAKISPALSALATNVSVNLGGDKLAKLKYELANLENATKVGPDVFGITQRREDELRRQIAALEHQRDLQSLVLKPSDLSKPGGIDVGEPGGGSRYKEIEDAQKAAEEAQRQFEQFVKDVEKYNETVFNALAKDGTEQARLDREFEQRWGEAHLKRENEELDTQHKLDQAHRKGNEELINGIENFRDATKRAFDDFLLHGEFTFKKLAAFILESLAVKELNKVLDSFLTSIEETIRRKTGGDSGQGDGIWSTIGGAVLSGAGTGTSASFAGGFATGGEFDVGGSGGTDSQLVAFAATPGEHVSVGKQDSGGDFNLTYHIDARGADAERIMTVMPSLLAQASEKAKRDVLEAFRRNGLAAPRSA